MSELKKCLLSKNVSEILKVQENMTTNGNGVLPVVDYNFLHGEFAANKLKFRVYANPPSLFFFLVAIWPLTAQVWSPVKTFSR